MNPIGSPLEQSAAPKRPRIGYVPVTANLKGPGDRRRFAGYAQRRRLALEIAQPEEKYDVVVVSEMADITRWSRYAHGKVVYDLCDSYLAIPRTDLQQLLRGPAKYFAG